MIAIQSLLYAALSGYSGVAQLVGSRVYPDIAPQDVARPFIVWQEISLQQAQDLSGTAETSSLNRYRIQVTCWARKATDARELDYQVRLAMNAASTFKSSHADTRSLDYEPDTKLFGHQSDFMVWLKT